MAKVKEYALYNGDNYIMSGTIEELASYLGVKRKTILFYATPTHQQRDPNGYAVTMIPDDDEDDDFNFKKWFYDYKDGLFKRYA